MTLMRHRYGYEADEPSDWTGFDDTNPLDEPVIDYSIWPPEPPDPEEARDENLRRLGKLTWRATLLSAVAAAGFAVLFRAHRAHPGRHHPGRGTTGGHRRPATERDPDAEPAASTPQGPGKRRQPRAVSRA